MHNIVTTAVSVRRLRCGWHQFGRVVALDRRRTLLRMSAWGHKVQVWRVMVPYRLSDGALGTGRWACQSFWELGKTATACGEEALKGKSLRGESPSTLDPLCRYTIGTNSGRELQAQHGV